MADVQITGLPSAADIADNDLFVKRDVSSTTDQKITFSTMTSGLLKASNNLSDVDNAATARSNIGAASSSNVLLQSNNLSDVDSVPTARTNLDVPSNTEALLAANNLSDLSNNSTARSNLSVPSNAEAALVGSTNDFNFNQIVDPQFLRSTETQFADGSISGTYTIDLNDGQTRDITIGGNTTFAFSNIPTSGLATGLSMYITDGGSFTVSWPASVIWSGGSAPSLTAGGTDLVVLQTFDNGTTWYGVLAGQNFA